MFDSGVENTATSCMPAKTMSPPAISIIDRLIAPKTMRDAVASSCK